MKLIRALFFQILECYKVDIQDNNLKCGAKRKKTVLYLLAIVVKELLVKSFNKILRKFKKWMEQLLHVKLRFIISGIICVCIDFLSFSAHADFKETSEFIQLLNPKNVILVHGFE